MEPQSSARTDHRDKACVGAILVEKFAPETLHQDEEFEYEVRLTNLSDATVESIVLVESLLSVIEVVGSEPASQMKERHSGRWLLGPLMPGAKRSVRIACTARRVLRFRSHTSLQCSQGG